MAVDILLDIDGIGGESQIKGFEGQIDVLSWNWGMVQSGTTHLGKGGGGGKVAVNDITFSKYVDEATPKLIKLCTTGAHKPKATLTVRKAGGDSPVDYLKIEMNTVMISSYNTGGANDGLDRVQETISLNFAKFTVTYTPQDESGAGAGADPFAFDIAQNTEV